MVRSKLCDTNFRKIITLEALPQLQVHCTQKIKDEDNDASQCIAATISFVQMTSRIMMDRKKQTPPPPSPNPDRKTQDPLS